MITKWGVSNFKSIATTRVLNEDGNEKNDFTFKLLTILCGANSSGKSSLLQSLLLMAQTMRNPNKDVPLILNGIFTNLGGFSDIKSKISDVSNDEKIQIQFSYKPIEDYIFDLKDYPFNCSFEDSIYTDIIDSSFSFNFINGGKEILPELSHFYFLIHFDDAPDKKLKYNKDGKENKLKRLWYNDDDFLSSNISSHEEYESNHFLPMNIKIKGMNLISMIALYKMTKIPLYIDDPFVDQIEITISDELKNLLKEIYGDEIENVNIHNCDEIELFYYGNNITKNLLSYLKNELLADIQGIGSLLYDFEFTHEFQGYPYKSLYKGFSSLQESTQHEIANKLKCNLDNLYKRIYDDLSDIKEKMKNKENRKIYADMSKTAKENIKGLSEEVKKCSNCIFADNFKGQETCSKCFFNTDTNNNGNFSDAEMCCYNILDEDFFVSKKIENFLSEIARYFSTEISYLGPLREDPKSLYHITDSSYANDIGKKGENTAAILALSNDEDKKNFPIPKNEASGICKTEEKSLKEAVEEWLKYIGVAESIEANIEHGGFSLQINTSGSINPSDLTNVGVGVSQVLPIVVMCLSAKEGATLILEQPELHLHPKMQTKLAEFFIAVSQSGRQCIIETHSEHIINALRYQVAKTETPHDDKLANDIQIYFAEKDGKGSLFKSIKMDKYAYISEWPENFFDEAQISNINTLKAINKKMEKDPPIE